VRGQDRARLVIAEDYEPAQYTLRRLLESRFDIVAVVGDGRALLDTVEQHHPDVALVDVSMSGMSGMAAAKQIREMHPEVKILFVSAHGEKIYREEAFRMGASGYLLKGLLQRELVTAVECVVSGGIYNFECADQ
jgi:DNA-binding NarL/FixJ family response regulator